MVGSIPEDDSMVYTDTPVHKQRLIGMIGQAVRRFKQALNPTMTFGKQSSQEHLQFPTQRRSVAVAETGGSSSFASSASVSAASSASADSRPIAKGRGQRSTYLFSPLPVQDNF